MDPIIEVENVSFSYQELPILQNVSFRVNKGELIGIFGPNGGGKTTLLKLLMGFLTPQKGTVKIFGQSPKSVRPKISQVPQKLDFDRQFPISVLDLVLLGRLSHLSWYGKFSKKDRLKALETLEKVGLKGYENKPFGTLSGGETQKALFARALISDPELLLLDEATASVDLQAETEIYHFLEQLKETMTILMVTHQLKTAVLHVGRAFCVQKEVIPLKTQEVCDHFALGLYHPLTTEKKEKP